MSTTPSGAQRETSAGGIVYRRQSGGDALFLLIRDSYRNWGFPKGHLEAGELPAAAAVREVREETGLDGVHLFGAIQTIDWTFRSKGQLVHKVCHFFLMRSECEDTVPQEAEGITACQWMAFDEAFAVLSYENARGVLARAYAMLQTAGECATRCVNHDVATATAAATAESSGHAPRH